MESELETMTERMLPCKMCEVELITESVYEAEFGMCLECSDLYWSHDHDDCSWECMIRFPERMREYKKKGGGI